MATIDIRPSEIRRGDRLHHAPHSTATVTDVAHPDGSDESDESDVYLDSGYYATTIPHYVTVTVDREA